MTVAGAFPRAFQPECGLQLTCASYASDEVLREYAARYVDSSCDEPGISYHYGTETHVNATCIRGLAFGIWIWQENV